MFGAFMAGSIVGKMVLDRTKWAQGVQAVQQDEKTIGGMSTRTAAGFQKMGTAMTVAGGVIVASIGGMIKKFVDVGDQIDKMSKRTGISAVTLSEFAHAADLSGTSLTSLEKGVRRMQRSITEAGMGLESYARSFRELGINIEELQKLDPESQFSAIMEAMAGVEDSTKKAALAQEIFGRAGTELLPMLSNGTEGLREMRQEAHDLGIVFDQEAAAKAALLKDEGSRLSASMKGLGFTLAEHLIPAVTSIVQKITDVVKKINEWAQAHPGLFSALTKAAAVLGTLLATLGPVLIIIPKIVAGLAMMKGAMAAMLGPTGLLIGALGALAVGYMKVKAAQEQAEAAARRAAEAEDNLFAKLKKASDAAGLSEKEFLKLRDAYNGNAAAMAMAIKQGKEGEKLQKALAEAGEEHREEIEKQKTAYEDGLPAVIDYSAALSGAATAMQTWTDYLKDIGIQTIQEKEHRVAELEAILRQLEQAYKDGKISIEDYVDAEKKVNEELDKYNKVITFTELPTRNLGDAASQAASQLDTLGYGSRTAKQNILEFANSVGWTTEQVQRNFINLSSAMFRLAGISIPTVSVAWQKAWPQLAQGATQTENRWAQVSQRIQDSWTQGLTEMLKGSSSLTGALSSVWDTIKTQFFTLIAQMVSQWTFGLIAKLAAGGGGLLNALSSPFKGLGKLLTGAESGQGGGGLFGGVSGSFLGSIAKMAGPIGIGLLVSKFIDLKKVGEAVTGTLVSAFEAVGTVITGIGNAASTILGGIASGIAGAAAGLGGLISGLTGLLSGGGKKYSEITHWLSLIREINQNLLNATQHIANQVDVMKDVHLSAINQSTQKAEELLDGRIPNKLDLIKDWTKATATRINDLKTDLNNRAQDIYRALTNKGTIYVDLFRSAVIDKLGTDLQTPLLDLTKAKDEINAQIAATEKQTAAVIADLERQLVTAEGNERKALQEKIEQLQLAAQQKRQSLLEQLQTIEKKQMEAATTITKDLGKSLSSLDSTLVSEFGGLGRSFSNDFSKFQKRIANAQVGGVFTEPQLVMTHGKPSMPEIIAPESMFERMALARSPVSLSVKNDVYLQGTIITDREYARKRLVKEILYALDDNVERAKQKLKEILGII